MTTQSVEANGLRFAYLEEGEGPLVLLLHGFPDTARSWDETRAGLAKRGFRAVSPYMRGYHPTATPLRDADQITLGRDALALIDALGERSAIVVGHDWGASAAYAAASLEPDKVRLLVTIGVPHPAAIQPSVGKGWALRHFVAYKMPGAAARFAAKDFKALREIYRRWSPRWDVPDSELAPVRESFSRRASLEAALGYYRALTPKLPAALTRPITVRTISFAGVDDPVMGPAEYHAAEKMFSAGYEVEEMPGGHFMHREHPDVFHDRLFAHLGRLE